MNTKQTNDLRQHLLDMLGAKDHQDAGRIIGELHAAKAHPSRGVVDEAMVEAACESYWGGGWQEPEHEGIEAARRLDARNMLEAALQAVALPAAPVAMAIDPQLAAFYQVATVAELLAAQEEHIQKLQDSARRNVKPWEDTFPPTLLPKYLRDSGLTPTRNNMEQVRSEAFNLADTVIEWIESGNVQAARDAIRDSLVAHAAPPAVPDTWQERLRAEYAELDERFTKLCAFLESERFASLHEDDRRLLQTQASGMRVYLNALTFRVDQIDYTLPAAPSAATGEGVDRG